MKNVDPKTDFVLYGPKHFFNFKTLKLIKYVVVKALAPEVLDAATKKIV